MGANIVRRRPPVRLPQPAEQRPTSQLTEGQLRELIFEHKHDRAGYAHDDLEAELELVDAHSGPPEATPISLPSASSQRLAHTLRRALQPEIGSAVQPALTTQRAPVALPAGTSEVALPGIARPANPRAAMLPLERPTRTTPAPAPPFVSDAPSPIPVVRSRLLGAGRARLAYLVLSLLALGAAAYLLQ